MAHYSPQSIHNRMYRTVLTDDQPFLELQFQKASALLPELEELNEILMEYEIFLLAGLLVNTREITELKERIDELRAK